MINQKPQRVFVSRWGLAYLEAFHLDSTFAASESRPFIRDSRHNSRPNSRDDGYRYDVFKITLRHLNYVYTGASDLNLAHPIHIRFNSRIGIVNGISCGRDADNCIQGGR
jgi:hypothetical protein